MRFFRRPERAAGISLVERRGVSLLLSKDNRIDKILLDRRPYEDAQLAFCSEFLRENQVGTFFDIGSNFGLYAVYFARRLAIRTHAFEPVNRNYLQLCANIFVNRLEGLVTPHPFALSDTEGSREIYTDRFHTGSCRLSEPFAATKPKHGERFSSEPVTARVFDGLYPMEGASAFIKIDTEGHELQVLRGMQGFLSKNKAFLQIECSEQSRDTMHELMGAYRFIHRIDSDYYFSNF